jgi:hypothetical protein
VIPNAARLKPGGVFNLWGCIERLSPPDGEIGYTGNRHSRAPNGAIFLRAATYCPGVLPTEISIAE